MQLVQQLLAAELNASAFGSVPSGEQRMFAQWEAAYCGTNSRRSNRAAAGRIVQLATVTATFTPGTSADSKDARAVAFYAFWDVLP